MMPRFLTRGRDCRTVRARFVDRLTGGLSDRQNEHDAAHLARCRACRDEYAALTESWNAMPDADHAAPPLHVREAVLAEARAAVQVPPHATRPDRSGARAPQGAHRVRGGVPSRRFLFGAGVASLAAAAVAVLLFTTDSPRIALGEEVPDLQATHVVTGAVHSLSDYRGDVVLLHVWATWCVPCEREMPSLQRLERRLGGSGLTILAVSVDQESRYKVRSWAEERQLGELTLLQDPTGRLEERYQLVGVPETFIIGPDGALLWREFGARNWDDPAQVDRIEAFLRRGGSS